MIATSPEIDPVTKAWMRNASDERAVANGCIFDESRARYVVDWIEANCCLWEGAKGPMLLRDWQLEATMRMFGWVRWSGRLGRWIRRFTRAGIWVCKKNAKSPTAAAWALYLMVADGEPGQKVFFAAADGQQARIMARHAVEMVKASPELSEVIQINLNEMKLTHHASLSETKPISSGDNRAARAKQGLNGSVVVDELHVLSRQFVSKSSIDKAGASRDEPFHIEVSTAGKDPDSYGRSQYDYGKSVERGDVDDQSLFFLCYEAPQNLSDENLAADPIKYGRMANPTWGRIIQEDEFLADYNRSKRSLADLADFKTFRLNIWQQASSPWLRKEDWDACKVNFTEDDLEGHECYLAMDLSLTRDMTNISACFPMSEGRFRLLSFFFLPETGFRLLADKVPQLHEWRRDGWIVVTPGSDLDYGFVKRLVERLNNKFDVRSLIYDPKFANHLTQQIEDELGIERQAFAQNIGLFAEPTAQFEKLVISQKMEHVGNPCMDWQIGHVNIKSDSNGYCRPIKPERADWKKIDGVIGGVQALAGALLGDAEDSWYQAGEIGQ